MYINFFFNLNFSELSFFIILLIISVWGIINNYRSKNWLNLFKPTTLFGALIIFYCLLGPIISSGQPDGSINYRGVDHRDFYEIGLLGALLTYLSFQLGFNYKKNIQKLKILV